MKKFWVLPDWFPRGGAFSQFWTYFRNLHPLLHIKKHVICHGFQRQTIYKNQQASW
jgi:hypothetical protein